MPYIGLLHNIYHLFFMTISHHLSTTNCFGYCTFKIFSMLMAFVMIG